MCKKITYTDVVKAGFDAGLFRVYLAQNYGHVFIYGGNYREWGTAFRMAKQLSRLTRETVDHIVEMAKLDYLYIDAEEHDHASA